MSDPPKMPLAPRFGISHNPVSGQFRGYRRRDGLFSPIALPAAFLPPQPPPNSAADSSAFITGNQFCRSIE
jgi:hypothetical protein